MVANQQPTLSLPKMEYNVYVVFVLKQKTDQNYQQKNRPPPNFEHRTYTYRMNVAPNAGINEIYFKMIIYRENVGRPEINICINSDIFYALFSSYMRYKYEYE